MSPRRGPWLVATALVLLIAATVASLRPWKSWERSAASTATPMPAEVTFARDPYIGVACPIGNDISCDRVKLAVLLSVPVRNVAASIGDLDFEMGARARGDEPLGTFWEGILQPAGVLDGPLSLDGRTVRDGRWLGENPPKATVRIEIEVDDRTIVRRTSVELRPGYG
ncbi:MAG: hypothetical protein ACRDKJ_08730 [Actinomycetota bacterium]